MPLPVPNLDDRDFAQLVAQAKAVIAARSPEWTDLSPGDPGITLLEAFAYLTDTLLYRVNRAPQKAFVQFLNLIGVALEPPSSASVELTFALATPAQTALVIPRGTRVTTPRGGADAPIFVTATDSGIAAGQRETAVLAHHGVAVEGELVGRGTGGPGQWVRVAQPPVTLPTGDDFDLVVGVEATRDELGGRVLAREHLGRTFRIWTEDEHFGAVVGDGTAAYRYVVDRTSGVITFAPAARVTQTGGSSGPLTPRPVLLAEVPAVDREIRVWYRSGGGAAGNVAAGSLTTLKDPIRGVEVTNRTPATGGRDGESLENAMIRGPQSIHTLDRVVTARDYEHFAVAASGAVSRARAVNRAELWTGATRGEVQLILVPSLEPGAILTAGAAELSARMTQEALDSVDTAVRERQPMGSGLNRRWVGLKRVRVQAAVVVNRTEDREAVASRLHARLARTLSPVPGDGATGWPFGEALRVSTVYDVLQAEAGVRYAADVQLFVDDVPGQVSAMVRDAHHPRTWFCGSEERVFRSVNDAEGWEMVATFDGEIVERLAILPGRPGVVVASTRVAEGEASVVRASSDYGDTWQMISRFEFHVEGFALATIDGEPHALLATDQGLFRQPLRVGATTDRIVVQAADPAMGIYAVATVVDPSGELRVAVAAQQLRGVFVSLDEGRAGTFAQTGLTGVDVRVLRGLALDNRRFLYAAAFATGDDAGDGVMRLELRGTEIDPQSWQPAGTGWVGGSCLDVALMGETVLAATARAGVTVTDPRQQQGAWRAPVVDSGLPLAGPGAFEPVTAVAVDGTPMALAGGPKGVHRSRTGRTWEPASSRQVGDTVSLPSTWLFVGADHVLDVRYDDAP